MRIRRTIGKLCVMLGCAFVLVAALLLVQNTLIEKHAEKANQAVLETLAEQSQLQENLSTTFLQDITHIGIASNPTVQPVPNADEQPETDANEAETILLENGEYCGVLTIARLGLVLPVQSELTYPNLKNSPCVYGVEDNEAVVIGAHNYAVHFGNLSQLDIGDSVQYTTLAGNVLVYTVAESTVVPQTNLNALQGAEDELLLFTCNAGNNHERVVVRCQL